MARRSSKTVLLSIFLNLASYSFGMPADQQILNLADHIDETFEGMNSMGPEIDFDVNKYILEDVQLDYKAAGYSGAKVETTKDVVVDGLDVNTMNGGQAAKTLVIETKAGLVEGFVAKRWQRVRQFEGIPYARPPVGELRLEQPQEHQSWSPKVLMATKRGPSCIQPLPVVQSENCLFLNVYTPTADRLTPTELLPVLFWIHGGGFQTGSAHILGLQNPHYMVQHRDVIVVSINYRLGALGFMVADDVNGNLGLYDQRLGLQWVHDNIKNFGGDPDDITVWGESAGAMSIGFHLSSPMSKPGFFKGAIMESNVLGYIYRTVEESKAMCRKVCKSVGCDGQCNKACLKTKNALKIGYLRLPLVFSKKKNFVAQILNWTPVIDGKLITDQPMKVIEQGKSLKVPVLLGYNTGEAGLLFSYLDIILGTPIGRSQPMITKTLYQLFVLSVFKRGPTRKILELYPASDDPEKNIESLIDMGGDFLGICPGLRASKTLSTASDTYFYVFNFTATILPKWLFKRCREKQVCHAMELPYVFHSIQHVPLLSKFTPEEHTLSHTIIDYLVKFVYGKMQGDGRTGVKFPYAHDNGNDRGIPYNTPEWKQFRFDRASKRFNYLHFAPTGKAEVSYEDYRKDYCEFWDTYEADQ